MFLLRKHPSLVAIPYERETVFSYFLRAGSPLAVMEELAYLFDALDAVDEGEGTLLDHSLVMACSEISEGRTHRLDEIPLLFGGGGCGKLVTGQHLRSQGSVNVNHAMLSVLRAFDVVAPTWGAGDTLVDTGWAPLEGA